VRGESDGTVGRLVEVLRHLAEAEGEVTVKGLAQSAGLPPSTAHRLLGLLAREGLVEPDPARHRYRPGLEYYRLAALIMGRLDLAALARPIMDAVVAECGETCVLGLYLPAERRMMFVARVDSAHPLRYPLELHRPLSVAWGATGRAILAFLPEAEIEAVLTMGEPSPATGASLPPPATMRRQLEAIRARSIAVSHGEKIPGAVGIAAPVTRAGGRVIGSLALTIPELRFRKEAESRLVELVRSRAAELSRALGAASLLPHPALAGAES
jgi:DNA-binding IclR family transcriptional regulator